MTDTQYTPPVFGIQSILDDLNTASEINQEFGFDSTIHEDATGPYIKAQSYTDDGDVSHTHRVYIQIFTSEGDV